MVVHFEQQKEMYGSVETDEESNPILPSKDKNRPPKIRTISKSVFASFRGTRFRRSSSLSPNSCVDDMNSCATMEEIDATIDLIATDIVGADVIRKIHPQRSWLWRQWRGTVFQYATWNASITVTISAILSIAVPMLTKGSDVRGHVTDGLAAFNSLWKYTLTLTTFILTFFLSQSYGLWRNVYNLCRSVQGRTNDFGLLCATHATRDENGEYTPEARQLLLDVAMAVRLFHAFCYATKARRFRLLHTDRALARMVERGIMTRDMYNAVQKLDVSTANRTYAMIEWIMIRWTKGLRDGTLRGGPGLEQMLLEKACLLRSQYGTFGDILDARIPLAYAHIVQVMVDTLLLCAPFALYSEMESLCIVAVAVLTIFFTGLMDLSKVMLDPLDNEDFCDGMIEMNCGVFVRESNGGSTRFWKGAEHLPEGWV